MNFGSAEMGQGHQSHQFLMGLNQMRITLFVLERQPPPAAGPAQSGQELGKFVAPQQINAANS